MAINSTRISMHLFGGGGRSWLKRGFPPSPPPKKAIFRIRENPVIFFFCPEEVHHETLVSVRYNSMFLDSTLFRQHDKRYKRYIPFLVMSIFLS